MLLDLVSSIPHLRAEMTQELQSGGDTAGVVNDSSPENPIPQHQYRTACLLPSFPKSKIPSTDPFIHFSRTAPGLSAHLTFPGEDQSASTIDRTNARASQICLPPALTPLLPFSVAKVSHWDSHATDACRLCLFRSFFTGSGEESGKEFWRHCFPGASITNRSIYNLN